MSVTIVNGEIMRSPQPPENRASKVVTLRDLENKEDQRTQTLEQIVEQNRLFLASLQGTTDNSSIVIASAEEERKKAERLLQNAAPLLASDPPATPTPDVVEPDGDPKQTLLQRTNSAWQQVQGGCIIS